MTLLATFALTAAEIKARDLEAMSDLNWGMFWSFAGVLSGLVVGVIIFKQPLMNIVWGALGIPIALFVGLSLLVVFPVLGIILDIMLVISIASIAKRLFRAGGRS